MKKNIALSGFWIIILAGFAAAQSMYTPDKGSVERTSILVALRMPVEKSLKQRIAFVTDTFNVKGDWAFIAGRPQQPDGSEPNYKNTPYADHQDAFDNNIFALFKKTGGKWKVVKYMIGCTDVCYSDWWETYKAPKDIFGMTE